MLKNEVLLRAILFAGFFLFFRPFFELFGLLINLPKNISEWVGIICAVIAAIPLHKIVYEKIQKSAERNNGLTTTLRWALYIFTGLLFFTLFIKGANSAFYEPPFDMKISFFTGTFLDRLKTFILFFGIIYVSFILSRYLVKKCGEVSELNLNLADSLPFYQTPVQPVNVLSPDVRSKGDKQTVHGSATFLDIENFNTKYNRKSNADMQQSFEEYGGYVLAPNEVRYIDHTHMITVAGAGQGKGTTAIIPNLLTKPHESWIVLDVKGENAAVTARYQQEMGQKVYILDPFNVQTYIEAKHHINSKGFNPLVVVKYLPEEEVTDFAAMMAEMLIPESNKNASSDNFFIDTARNTLKTYILHIITDKELANRNLGLLYEWLRLDQEKEIELWVDMSLNPNTKFGTNEIKSLAINSSKTWLGVLSEMRRATSFLESPLIRKSLESEDFDPMTLQRGGATVYVILPERNLNTHKSWLRLVFGTTLKLCNFIAKKRVNFLMDEFPILGRMDDFLRAFAFGRGQKISCWIIAQSLSQLKEIYGEEGLNTFLSNAKLRQFFGVNDYYTQKYVSDLLGMTTEITSTLSRGMNKGVNTGTSTNSSESYTSVFGGSSSSGSNSGMSSGTNMGDAEQLIARPLMNPEEVGKLKNDFVLLVDGDKYIFPKHPYYSQANYHGKFDDNPYVTQV
jgi:type IV secretory pathway TraG/TraD family ATPase VirD4